MSLSSKDEDKIRYDIGYRTKAVKTGVSCIFVSLSRTEGAKCYTSRADRDLAYNRQKRAFNRDIGPACGTKFKLSVYDWLWGKRHMVYGFITQKARLVPDIHYAKHKQIDKLRVKLKKNRLPHWDLHDENVGYIEGRLVCIDFMP